MAKRLPDLRIDKLHGHGACSTVIIHGLGETDFSNDENGTEISSAKVLAGLLRDAREHAETEVEDYWDSSAGWMGDEGYTLGDYSFVIASTTSLQPMAQKALLEFGFVASIEQHNKKNDSVVTLFVMPAPAVCDRIESLV